MNATGSADASIEEIRSGGWSSPSGRYGRPDLSTPSIATTRSALRGNRTATGRPGSPGIASMAAATVSLSRSSSA